MGGILYVNRVDLFFISNLLSTLCNNFCFSAIVIQSKDLASYFYFLSFVIFSLLFEGKWLTYGV